MTNLENAAHAQITKKLNEQGYPSYARLFSYFDLHLTDDPKVVGYMIPNKASITINKNLDIDQVSVIIRHEILHEYLTHQLRMERKLGKDVWDKRTGQMHKKSNIAGDYEISNVGYTEADKAIARAIKLNGVTLKGLVTEDDHPDWVGKSFEEMYDLLQDEDIPDNQLKLSISLEDLENALDEIEDQLQQGGLPQDSSIDGVESDASDDAKTDGSSDLKGKISKELSKGAQSINDMKSDDDVLPDDAEAQKRANLANRLTKIKKLLDELAQSKSLEREAKTKKKEERDIKAQKEAEKYKSSPLYKFDISLNKFLRNYIEDERDKTWSRYNRHTIASGIYSKGEMYRDSSLIPLFNVYFDQSGSWDESDIEEGKKAIRALNKYVQNHQIRLQLYYFSNNVHSKSEDARREGSTEGTPIIEHIKETNPQNVIIITDSDIDDVRESVTINGGAWFLFRGRVSDNIYDSINAKLGKQKFIF